MKEKLAERVKVYEIKIKEKYYQCNISIGNQISDFDWAFNFVELPLLSLCIKWLMCWKLLQFLSEWFNHMFYVFKFVQAAKILPEKKYNVRGNW